MAGGCAGVGIKSTTRALGMATRDKVLNVAVGRDELGRIQWKEFDRNKTTDK